MPRTFSLRIVEGPDTGTVRHFDQEVVNIGRNFNDNDFVLADPSISSRHARITAHDDGFYLEDLGSSNGTYYKKEKLVVNDSRLLSHGGQFSLGKIVLYFTSSEEEYPGDEPSEKTFVLKDSLGNGESRDSGLTDGAKKRLIIIAACVVALLAALALAKNLMAPLPSGLIQTHLDMSSQPVALPAQGEYGFTKKSDKTHPDKVIFTFMGISRRAHLLYTPGGIDSGSEVAIYLNGNLIGHSPLAMNGWGREQTLQLPRDKIIKDSSNQLVFDSTKNPPQRETWAVKAVRIEFLPEGKCDEQEAKRSFDLAEHLYSDKTVSPGNVFRAYQKYSEAISRVEECSIPPEFLKMAQIGRDTTKQEIDTSYNAHIFSYKKAIKVFRFQDAANSLKEILLLIPDRDEPRHRETTNLLRKLRGRHPGLK